MKKTYFSPVTKVTKIQLSNMLLELSSMSFNEKNGKKGTVLSRENNDAWDIWGQGDYEED